MTHDDPGSDEQHRALVKLRRRFPGFTFRLITTHGNTPCIEAVRRRGAGPEGLYAAISSDPAELASELEDAA